jgi:uncharacterized membrane protein
MQVRVENSGDGVLAIAIAITLLALTVACPEAPHWAITMPGPI